MDAITTNAMHVAKLTDDDIKSRSTTKVEKKPYISDFDKMLNNQYDVTSIENTKRTGHDLPVNGDYGETPKHENPKRDKQNKHAVYVNKRIPKVEYIDAVESGSVVDIFY